MPLKKTEKQLLNDFVANTDDDSKEYKRLKGRCLKIVRRELELGNKKPYGKIANKLSAEERNQLLEAMEFVEEKLVETVDDKVIKQDIESMSKYGVFKALPIETETEKSIQDIVFEELKKIPDQNENAEEYRAIIRGLNLEKTKKIKGTQEMLAAIRALKIAIGFEMTGLVNELLKRNVPIVDFSTLIDVNFTTKSNSELPSRFTETNPLFIAIKVNNSQIFSLLLKSFSKEMDLRGNKKFKKQVFDELASNLKDSDKSELIAVLQNCLNQVDGKIKEIKPSRGCTIL